MLFSTGGVLLGHMITNTPFGIMMSGVGTIALAGIVVNNNIVLIDTYNFIRRTAGLGSSEAILRTCAQRLAAGALDHHHHHFGSHAHGSRYEYRPDQPPVVLRRSRELSGGPRWHLRWPAGWRLPPC